MAPVRGLGCKRGGAGRLCGPGPSTGAGCRAGAGRRAGAGCRVGAGCRAGAVGGCGSAPHGARCQARAARAIGLRVCSPLLRVGYVEGEDRHGHPRAFKVRFRPKPSAVWAHFTTVPACAVFGGAGCGRQRARKWSGIATLRQRGNLRPFVRWVTEKTGRNLLSCDSEAILGHFPGQMRRNWS